MDLRLFATLLGVALIVLRLAGVIDWHWALVLFPFWPVFAILAFLILVWTIVGTAWIFSTPKQRERQRNARELQRLKRHFGLSR